MPKYVEEKVAGYWLYYTATCINEGIVHVHANKPTTGRKNSAKLWVYEDGHSSVAEIGQLKKAELLQIQDWIADNIDIIRQEWFDKNPDRKIEWKIKEV